MVYDITESMELGRCNMQGHPDSAREDYEQNPDNHEMDEVSVDFNTAAFRCALSIDHEEVVGQIAAPNESFVDDLLSILVDSANYQDAPPKDRESGVLDAYTVTTSE